jgi:hypothetical protein
VWLYDCDCGLGLHPAPLVRGLVLGGDGCGLHALLLEVEFLHEV